MSNKEKLAEEYAKEHERDYFPGTTDFDAIEKSFISGYEAAEQEMIRFVEWIQESNHSMLLGCCKKEDVGKWVYPGGVVDTTQQLRDKFREHH